ncbi:MAG TPA: serine hydrolase domain-containing protein, partial [Streptosporangiaceae bacterium]|nr:serine hydrolase domain-containing protein [Streptosporangiaceae bacterium]
MTRAAPAGGGRQQAGPAIPPPRFAASYQAFPGQPADGFAAVSRLLLGRLAAGLPPAAAMVVCSPAGVRYQAAGGWASLGHGSPGPGSAGAGPPGSGSAGPVPAGEDTRFDLASLTKMVVTVPLALLLHQRGAWDIDEPIARWLDGAPGSTVTIRGCLTHTSGLVAHRPFFATCPDAAAIRRAVVSELATVSGGPVCYSDLNFMLLGWAIENCAGERLDALAEREVFRPLGMASTGFRPAVGRAAIAATEASGDEGDRPGLIWGQVHDGNAFALGGVSGHAGVFATAADLGRFTAALLTPGRHPVLGPAAIALMSSRHAAVGEDVRAIGWRLRPAGWGNWPASTLWHTGFTGTSLLVSPPLGAAVVLLTNAVHPARRPAETAALRAQAHRAVRRAIAKA